MYIWDNIKKIKSIFICIIILGSTIKMKTTLFPNLPCVCLFVKKGKKKKKRRESEKKKKKE